MMYRLVIEVHGNRDHADKLSVLKMTRGRLMTSGKL